MEGRAGRSRAAEGIAGPLRGFVPLHTLVPASHVLLECGFFFLSVLCYERIRGLHHVFCVYKEKF